MLCDVLDIPAPTAAAAAEITAKQDAGRIRLCVASGPAAVTGFELQSLPK